MEFIWKGQPYKLYGVGSCHHKKRDFQVMKKAQEKRTNMQQQKQAKYVTKEYQGFTLNK